MICFPFPLRDSFRVEPLPNGHVAVTVELPAHLVKDYCQLLDALSGFFASVQTKSDHVLAAQRASDRKHDPEVQRFSDDYTQQVVALFDQYTLEGLTRNDAIKRISSVLREQNHPWRFPEQVRSTLSSSGRPGRIGRPPRGES